MRWEIVWTCGEQKKQVEEWLWVSDNYWTTVGCSCVVIIISAKKEKSKYFDSYRYSRSTSTSWAYSWFSRLLVKLFDNIWAPPAGVMLLPEWYYTVSLWMSCNVCAARMVRISLKRKLLTVEFVVVLKLKLQYTVNTMISSICMKWNFKTNEKKIHGLFGLSLGIHWKQQEPQYNPFITLCTGGCVSLTTTAKAYWSSISLPQMEPKSASSWLEQYKLFPATRHHHHGECGVCSYITVCTEEETANEYSEWLTSQAHQGNSGHLVELCCKHNNKNKLR